MAKVAMKTFEEAISKTNEKDRILLLGNGFSRSLRDDIFSYDSLLEKADFSNLSECANEAFKVLTTTDFEAVIKALQYSSALVTLYERTNKTLIKKMKVDAEGLKETLVKTIAEHHPSHPSEIKEDQYTACRQFLGNFGKIYTLNYDLLLYWAIMHSPPGNKNALLSKFDDGFRHPSDEESDIEYVTWDGHPYGQTLFYLHGALHLFESESELQKFTWARTGIRLLAQIKEALKKEWYPLIVAEGKSAQKKGRILRSGYLTKALRSLREARGTLFMFGIALSGNDSHVLKAIQRSKIDKVWISLHGDPTSDVNKAIIREISRLANSRPQRSPLEIHYYDAASAKPWG